MKVFTFVRIFISIGSILTKSVSPMQIYMDSINTQKELTTHRIPSMEDEIVPRPDVEIQCIRHYEYATFVLPDEVHNFYSPGIQMRTLRTFVNEKGRMKYYFCTPCTVCGSGVRIMAQCQLKQDTACDTLCLNETLVYDFALKRCFTSNQLIKGLFATFSTPIDPYVFFGEGNDGQKPPPKKNKWKSGTIVIAVGALMFAAIFILRELKKRKADQRPAQETIKRRTQNNRRDLKYQTVNQIEPSHTVVNIESKIPPSKNHVTGREAANALKSTTCRTKESNLNRYGPNLQPLMNSNTELVVQSHFLAVSETKITVTPGTPPYWLVMSGLFGPRGGELSCNESDVVVQIPPGAIPTSHCNQLIVVKVSKTLEHFSVNDLPEDSMFLSPLVDCESPGLKRFNKDITIKLPHRAKLSPHWKFAVHFTDDSTNGQRWNTVSGAMHNEHRVSESASDVSFSIDEKFVKISTPHFSQYTCSGCGGKKRQLSLESVIYVKYTNLHDTGRRVDLHCYILDTIKDFQSKVNRNEHHRPHSEHRPLAVDAGGKKTELQIALVDMGELWPWYVDEHIHKHIQVVSLTDIVRCHSDSSPYYATFTLRPKHPKSTETRISLEAAVDVKQIASKKAYSNGVTVEIAFNLDEICDDITDKEDICSKDTADMQDVFTFLTNKTSLFEWKPLYRKLMSTRSGCPLNIEADISDIENRHQSDTKEQRYEAFMRWLKKFGKDATLSRLCNCLRQVGMVKVAEDVEENFGKGHEQLGSSTRSTCTVSLVECNDKQQSLETVV